MNNTTGKVVTTTLDVEFACFDALPVTLRDELRYANGNISAATVLAYWRRGFPEARLIEAIRRFEC